MEIYKKIKPLSVNRCWQGKRFKTLEYKLYEKQLMLMLPKLVVPVPPYKVYYEFGFSSAAADWDNPIKPLQDILQTKYKFNDKDILNACVQKRKVDKGEEYFIFMMEHYEENGSL